MVLFLPPLGSRLLLLAPWTFTLYNEHRTEEFIKALYPTYYNVPGGAKGGYYYEYFHSNGLRSCSIDYRERIRAERNYAPFGKSMEQVRDEHLKESLQDFENKIAKYLDTYGDFPPILRPTLPAGTELTVDRIYVRKGQKGYDSLSFFIRTPKLLKKHRFWAKLSECNGMEFELLPPPEPKKTRKRRES